MPDTHALIARCRRGDDLAWERLVRDYQGRVYAIAYHYVQDTGEASDISQEAFVRVYQKLDTFGDGAFLPWLVQIVRNLCIDHLRRRKTRPPLSDVLVEDDGETLGLSAHSLGPDEVSVRDSRRRLVYKALRRLTDQARELILLKEIQGLKLREIAELLAVPVGTVKSRSNRARLELAEQVVRLDPSYDTRPHARANRR